MAIAAGIAPHEAAQLDARTFAALRAALDERWTQSDELLASLVELLWTLICVQLRLGGDKRRMPTLRVPRPDDVKRKRERKPQTGSDLVRALGARRIA